MSRNILLIGIIIASLVLSASCIGKKPADPFRNQPPAQPQGAAGGETQGATTTGSTAPGQTEVKIPLPEGVTINPVDFVAANQNAYLIDPTYGLIILDITDTSKFKWVQYDGIADNPPTALAVEGSYAYVGIGNGGLLVIDVDPLEEASVVATFSDAGSVGKIKLSGTTLYTADPVNGLQLIDVTDPTKPSVLAKVDGSFYGIDYADGYAYLATGADGLTIADVDPPSDAQIVNTVPTVPNGSAMDVKVLGGYAYLATGKNGPDEVQGPTGLEVINVTPPENAAVVHTVGTAGDLANKVVLFEGFAYAWSGDNTIDVIDISTPAEASIKQTWSNWSSDKRIATFGPVMFVLQYKDGITITAATNQ
jgi:hypothetical protein